MNDDTTIRRQVTTGKPGFHELQRTFAAYLRDPSSQAMPVGIEPRRMAIYRDLFFRNVDGFLRAFFPVLHSLYTEEQWLELAYAFFAEHRAKTPFFLEIAEEFLVYLEGGHRMRPCDPPYMRELAHYEWLELALDVSEEEIPSSGIVADGDLMTGIPVVNPLAILMRYEWPVHRLSATHADVAPEETFLLVYRNRSDDVRFQLLNAVSARLFACAAAQMESTTAPMTGEEMARQIVQELNRADPAAVIAGAASTMQEWRVRDIVLGTREIPSS